MTRSARTWRQGWLLALVLASPSFILVIAHCIGFWRAGSMPTGFIQADQPYYMANARELFDDGRFHLFYGNPFSFDYATPRIYFQPLILLLGAIAHVTGAQPGLVFALAGVVFAIVCVRVGIALFDECVSRETTGGRVALVSFVWGGGLLVIAGVVWTLIHLGPSALTDGRPILRFDPFDGWWFLNFGRNLVLPLEAAYHALFLGAVAAILARRLRLSLVLAMILSASHPFSGIQLLAVLLAWSVAERFVFRSDAIPAWYPAVCLALFVAHVGYYLGFLGQFPEHRIVQKQWELPWTLSIRSLVYAHLLVVIPIAWRMRTRALAGALVGDWRSRLLFAWFLVSLVLAKHELFMRPTQPLHFTRGYMWIPLFLLGAPALVELVDRVLLADSRRQFARLVAIPLLLLVILSDNIGWFALNTADALAGGRVRHGEPRQLGMALQPDAAELMRWLSARAERDAIVVSDEETSYQVTVFTPLRSWASHFAITPEFTVRAGEIARFRATGEVPELWRGKRLLFVNRRGAQSPAVLTQQLGRPAELVHSDSTFEVIRVDLTVGETSPTPR